MNQRRNQTKTLMQAINNKKNDLLINETMAGKKRNCIDKEIPPRKSSPTNINTNLILNVINCTTHECVHKESKKCTKK